MSISWQNDVCNITSLFFKCLEDLLFLILVICYLFFVEYLDLNIFIEQVLALPIFSTVYLFCLLVLLLALICLFCYLLWAYLDVFLPTSCGWHFKVRIISWFLRLSSIFCVVLFVFYIFFLLSSDLMKSDRFSRHPGPFYCHFHSTIMLI